MALYTANGLPLVEAKVCMPRVGVWHADVVLDGDEKLVGPVTLQLGATVLKGTARSWGITFGRAMARIIGGAAGFRSTVPAKSYRDVPLSIPLKDILAAAGETLSGKAETAALNTHLPTWILNEEQGGVAMSLLVQAAAGASWRVLEDGTVWVGQETWGKIEVECDELAFDPVLLRGIYTARSPDFLPGTTFNGGRISYVEHRIHNAKLHSTLWFEA